MSSSSQGTRSWCRASYRLRLLQSRCFFGFERPLAQITSPAGAEEELLWPSPFSCMCFYEIPVQSHMFSLWPPPVHVKHQPHPAVYSISLFGKQPSLLVFDLKTPAACVVWRKAPVCVCVLWVFLMKGWCKHIDVWCTCVFLNPFDAWVIRKLHNRKVKCYISVLLRLQLVLFPLAVIACINTMISCQRRWTWSSTGSLINL